MIAVTSIPLVSVGALVLGLVSGAGAGQPVTAEESPDRTALVRGDTTALEIVPVSKRLPRVAFGQAVEVKVRVENAGEPVAHVPVEFRVGSGDGTIADSPVVTGTDGVATALWLPGTIAGAQSLNASLPGAELEISLDVMELEPGKSYFGRNEYVEYIPGELPIILTSPHAGKLRPSEIPDRQRGVTVRDGEIHDIALRTAAALEELTGKRPHVVLSHLRRVKLDPNRAIRAAAQGNEHAERAWHEYHGWIETAKELVGKTTGRGFYFDLHGHGHKEQRLELGYLLRGKELELSDAEIDSQAALLEKSSVRTLATESREGLAEILRGENSFGEIMVRHGYRAVPSRSEPDPAGERYFNGGYSTVRHGSRNGGVIDGIQIEHNYRGLRDSPAARKAYSEALAKSILEYLEKQLGLDLKR